MTPAQNSARLKLGVPYHLAVVDSAGNVSIQKACVARAFFAPAADPSRPRDGVIYAAGPGSAASAGEPREA